MADTAREFFGDETAPISANIPEARPNEGTGLRSYVMNHVTKRFHESKSFERLLWGPVGCGKTFAMMWEMLLYSLRYPVCKDGLIRTRFIVVRNTYMELRDTSLDTFLQVFPLGPLCEYNKTEKAAKVRLNNIRMEVQFRALDLPQDVKKIKSINATGYVFNELSEIVQDIYEFSSTRCGRYPSIVDLGQKPYGCIISDTNPTHEDHWVFERFEKKPHPEIQIFTYPSGIAPEAVNLENLPDGYYTQQMTNRSPEWLRRYRDGEAGPLAQAGVVFTSWSERLHLLRSDESLFDPRMPLFIGIDYGRTPTAIFAQQDKFARWIVLDELGMEDMTISEFGPVLLAHMERRGYMHANGITCTGDPSGEFGSEKSNWKTGDLLEASIHGAFRVDPAFTNNVDVRHMVVANPMTHNVGGVPRIRVHCENCPELRKAFISGYVRNEFGKIVKNMSSHFVDALGYCLLGGGEDREIMRDMRSGEPRLRSELGFSPSRPRHRSRSSTLGKMPW